MKKIIKTLLIINFWLTVITFLVYFGYECYEFNPNYPNFFYKNILWTCSKFFIINSIRPIILYSVLHNLASNI